MKNENGLKNPDTKKVVVAAFWHNLNKFPATD